MFDLQADRMNTYAIEAIGIHRIKIGRARNVFARIADLQIGCPVDLQLFAAWGMDLESDLHHALRPHRIRGEWFALNTTTRSILKQKFSAYRIRFRPPKELEMPRAPKNGLSSHDPSSKSIAVRLPSDLVEAVHAACEQQGITPSEFLRALVASWAHGNGQLSGVSGPDAGYMQARSMASQLAHAVLRRALAEIPVTHEEAREMLQAYYADQAARRGG